MAWSILFFFFHYVLLTNIISTSRFSLACHDSERAALVQFKDSFTVTCQASSDPSAYPKIRSWKDGEKGGDCCSWEGVFCDNVTGRVVGLELSSSCLNGHINSSSSLFRLPDLRHLNLADNDFSQSRIPSRLGQLSSLTCLNLSLSAFSGRIPYTILGLTRLSSLDLSYNEDLSLKNHKDYFFDSLVQNLTGLEHLILDLVDISSPFPDVLANLSTLKTLSLYGCWLYGEAPVQVFQLPKLRNLVLSSNMEMGGYLPDFNSSSPLQALELSHTRFSGKLPASIGNLASLSILNLWNCSFSGDLPASLGNNTLLYLDVSDNNFNGQSFASLSWLGEQTKLNVLGLMGFKLNGNIPNYFSNMTHLVRLFLSRCELTGQIPPFIFQRDKLKVLDLSNNDLQGPFPYGIFQLKDLKFLNLAKNNLTGMVELDMFSQLGKLSHILLTGNRLTLLDKVNYNLTFQKFTLLELGDCNLNHFPHFLRDQDELQYLSLPDNNLHGLVPEWIWNTSKDTLEYVSFSGNFLTGFEHHPPTLPWSQLNYLDLSFNMFQGSLPMPPLSIQYYAITANNFSGELSPHICNSTSILGLDLADNNLGGTLPSCLSKLSASLRFLVLEGNKFHGEIPQTYTTDCNIRMIRLGDNRLEGKLPRSLSSCSRLEFLNVGHNRLDDIFPSWLGALRNLKVLILRANHFHGVLGSPTKCVGFPELRIIDLSWNNFSGQLPVNYFLNWKGMQLANADRLEYLSSIMNFALPNGLWVFGNTTYSMSLTNKGTILEYKKIMESFVAIDLSGNRFEGNLPQGLGNLKGLRMLNLSNNMLSGHIPTSLSSLSLLESLDLSSNNLTGEIPQELAQLNFLSVFNVSYNKLTGHIPSGKQFNTFDNTSYQGNPTICGDPLSRKCANPKSSSPLSPSEDSDSMFNFGWRPVAIGYGSGVAFGLVVGHIVVTKYFAWFARLFRLQRFKRRRRRGRN